MKPTPLIFAGIFASIAVAWCGLVVVPYSQIGNLQPQVDEENADIYPINVAGITERGRQVYLENGCNYCHTQQARDPKLGADALREWAPRRSVARDYIYDDAAVLGTIRNGPDLSNLGAPKADDSKRKYVNDLSWMYQHLYSPTSVVEGSIMPSFRHLFIKRKVTGEPSPEALKLGGSSDVSSEYEIVPSDDAKALVAYLLSLDKSHPLKEVKGAAPAAK